jgi:hypothetical protein
MYQEIAVIQPGSKTPQKINFILRLSDNMHIHMERGNKDYEEYLEWLAKGNKPKPVPVSPSK